MSLVHKSSFDLQYRLGVTVLICALLQTIPVQLARVPTFPVVTGAISIDVGSVFRAQGFFQSRVVYFP